MMILLFEINKSDFFIALTAAIFTGFISLVITIYLAKRDKTHLINRLQCVLLVELINHQVTLQGVLDYVIPAWLHRGEEDHNGIKSYTLIKLDVCSGKLPITYFESFFNQLVFSKIIVPIAYYYEAIKQFNKLIDRKKDMELIDFNTHYIRDCATLLDTCLQTIDDILKIKGINKYFTEVLKNLLENFESSKLICKILIAISHLQYCDLEALDYYIRKIDLDKNKIWRIQKIILEDPKEYWLSYFYAASKL